MVDSTLAFDIMARDDGATAVLAKVERALDKTGNAAKKNSKISADAAKASAALTKAHNAESDALGKVEVAEQRLAEVRSNSKAKTSQIVTAEKALAKARRDAAVAGDVAQKASKELSKALDDEGKNAGKGFSSNLKKWLTGSSGLSDAGKAGGTVFGSGFLGVIKTPILGPAVVAAIAAGVVTALPAVGAVAASGLVAGFGAGLAGLGIVFAAKSVAVKNAWNRTIWSMGKDMTLLSKPFESTLVSIAGFARRTFATFAPSLQQNFKELAPVVTQFADDLGRGFERLGPAIRPLSEAFEAVLHSLGPAMQTSLGSISDGLVKLSESVKKNPDGLSDLVTGMGALTNKALGLVAALNDVNGMFERMTGGTSAVDLIFGQANSKIGSFVTTVKNAVDPLGGIKSGLDAIAGSASKASTAVGLTGSASLMFTQGLNAAQVKAVLAGKSVGELGAAAGRTAAQTHAANVAAFLLATAFDRQFAATQKANDALTRMSGLLQTLSGSEISYQQAVDDATQALKDNGKTHDINTQKGRDNQSALNAVAAAAQAQTVAMRNNNVSQVQVAKTAEGARASYVRLAIQMGYNKAQAQAMAAQFIAVPNVTRTAKLQANISDLQGKLKTAETALKSPHLTATKRANLEAKIANLQAGIANAKRLLAGLPPTRTAAIKANIADLQSKLATAKTQLASKDLTKERRATLTANIAKLQAGIASAKASLASLPGSKTITVTTRLVTIKSSITSGSGVGGGHSVVGKGSAGGGLIPGAPSSVDNHLRPMATGEFVVQAAKVPGNLAVLKAINDGKYKASSGGGSGASGGSSSSVGASVASGMAQGMLSNASSAYAAAAQVAAGMITKAKSVLGISSPSKAFAQLGLYVNQGFKIGLLGSAKSVQSVMASLMGKVLNIAFNAADTKKAAQKQVATYSAQVAAATTTASRKAAQARLRQAKADLANVNSIASRLGTTVKRNAVIGMLQRENVAMQKLANARAVVANNLKAAQTKLAAAIQVRDDFKKSITDAALSFNSIVNITSDSNQSLGSQDILAHMQQTLAKTKEFASELSRLKGLGLRSDLYKQIADAGVDGGGATAAALLQGGKGAVAAANDLQRQIANASAGLGNTAADNMYKAGVDAAQGLVNGLLAKTKALDAASKKLALAIVAQIKKTLGIHSPSKVMEWHGSMAAVGFTKGIEGEYGRVMKAGAALGTAAIPGRTSKTGTVRSTGGGGETRVVFEFKTDGSPHMEWLAGEFRKYVRATAGGNVQQAFGTGK